MVFSSITFLYRFLPIIILLYFLAPKRMRNFILFFGSLFFYAWGEPIYVILLLFSTLIDYLLGRAVGKYREYKNKSKARFFLICSIFMNLTLLFYFKYMDFFIISLNKIFNIYLPFKNVVLPLGISFYTFQTMSYTIDIYRHQANPQKNILYFGMYVTSFPQLVAGPIVKYHEIVKEIVSRKVNIIDISNGIQRFILGLSKKVLLANQIGFLFDRIRLIPIQDLTLPLAWIGIISYAFQIYFDFSGYSDMAIGLGLIFGFHFPENFNYPYLSTSITQFWQRWHISLSSWFKENVYIPLGGNKKGIIIQLRNILIVWLLTGLWHGASYNFLLWGLWYALLLVNEKVWLLKLLKKLPSFMGRIYTLLAVLIGWVFFVFTDLSEISNYLKVLFGVMGRKEDWMSSLEVCRNQLLLLPILSFAATNLPLKIAQTIETKTYSPLFYLLKLIFLFTLVLLSTAYIVDASYNPFLYFRF